MQKKKRETGGVGRDTLVVQKKLGETMGQLIARVRKSLEIPPTIKMTFAGRLDPLARGLVLILQGEKRYEKEAFLALPKSYAFDIVFDVKTDTLDVLGKVIAVASIENSQTCEETETELRGVLTDFLGKNTQFYPDYSSKTINGIPLFEYARKKVPVKIPTKDIEIYSLKLGAVKEISKADFMSSVKKKISAVHGDFRQKEIWSLWNKMSKDLPQSLLVAHLVVECSSGTYVRVLAEKIALRISRIGIADNITRTRIGEFTKDQIIV